MVNLIFLILSLVLMRPEIYNFGDSVKVVIPKKGIIGEFERQVEKGHFKIILPPASFTPPYSYKIQTDYLLGLEFYKRGESLVIDFRFTELAERYRVKKQSDRLEIVFFKKLQKRKEIKEKEMKEEEKEPEKVYSPPVPLQAAGKKGRKIKKIVIDPGHGGRDAGAVGRRGAKEKDINLQVAKLLRDMIVKELKVDVVLTREKDTFISLRERSVIANMENADIFISLHCNASRRLASRGIEVYFLSEAKTDWERAVEALENASLKFELPEKEAEDILDAILLDLAQTEFLKESQKLAEFIQKSLVDKEEMDRGVKQAGFYVLYGVYMPAVLIEMGFITNPQEERLLRSKKYQKRICKKIVEGMKKFIEWYGE